MSRPRFSLRTLVLSVCLVPSVFGLWWRWEPWIKKDCSEAMPINLESKTPDSPDGSRFVMVWDGMLQIWEGSRASNKRPTTLLSTLGYYGPAGAVFIDDDTLCVSQQFLEDDEGEVIKTLYFTFRRRRPEWWWGIAWLWEFWATLLLGLALLWPLVRKGRMRKSRPPP